MPTLTEKISPTGEVFQVKRDAPFPRRYAYARSTDTRAANDIGQDYLTFRHNDHAFVFALCDGVSQSFYGDLAARMLGDALVEWLWNQSVDNADVESLSVALTEHLNALTAQATELVQSHQPSEDISPMLREVLEQKRAKGSESTFVCGRIDLPSAKSPDGRVFLAWMGDSRVRFWGPLGERTRELGDTFQTAQRWSSRQGPVSGKPNLFIAPLEQNQSCQITSLMAYSDGLAALDRFSRSPRNTTVQELIAHANESATSDDISFIELWLDQIPSFVERAPLPAPRRLVLNFKDSKVSATWQPVSGASIYEVEIRNGAAQTVQVGNQTSWESSVLVPGEYQVRVRGYESEDPGSWSSGQRVTIPSPEIEARATLQPASSGLSTTEGSTQKSRSRGIFNLSAIVLLAIVCMGAWIAFSLLGGNLSGLPSILASTLAPTASPISSSVPTIIPSDTLTLSATRVGTSIATQVFTPTPALTQTLILSNTATSGLMPTPSNTPSQP